MNPFPSPQTSLYYIVKVHCLWLRLETQTKTSINILKAHLLTAELFHSVPWLNYLCTNYIFSLITSGTSLGRLPTFLHPTARYYLEKLHTKLVSDDVWSKRPLIQPAAVSPPLTPLSVRNLACFLAHIWYDGKLVRPACAFLAAEPHSDLI